MSSWCLTSRYSRVNQRTSENDSGIMLLAGLVFDGHERFRNISDAVDDPQIGRLSVFTNPSFETFDGTRRYDPDDEEVIDIKVRHSINCTY